MFGSLGWCLCFLFLDDLVGGCWGEIVGDEGGGGKGDEEGAAGGVLQEVPLDALGGG